MPRAARSASRAFSAATFPCTSEKKASSTNRHSGDPRRLQGSAHPPACSSLQCLRGDRADLGRTSAAARVEHLAGAHAGAHLCGDGGGDLVATTPSVGDDVADRVAETCLLYTSD